MQFNKISILNDPATGGVFTGKIHEGKIMDEISVHNFFPHFKPPSIIFPPFLRKVKILICKKISSALRANC